MDSTIMNINWSSASSANFVVALRRALRRLPKEKLAHMLTYYAFMNRSESELEPEFISNVSVYKKRHKYYMAQYSADELARFCYEQCRSANLVYKESDGSTTVYTDQQKIFSVQLP